MTEKQKTYGFMGAGSDAREPEDLPAFPVAAGQTVYTSGMTLRDYAAIEMMAALISGQAAAGEGFWSAEELAKESLQFADALLTERSKTGDEK